MLRSQDSLLFDFPTFIIFYKFKNIKNGETIMSIKEAEQIWEEILDTYSIKLYELYQYHPKTEYKPWLNNTRMMHEELASVSKLSFFTSTTLTSLGYGINAPTSMAGRIFVMIYVLVGIPLMLITLADLAKFCTEATSWLCLEFLKMKFRWARRWRHFKERRKKKFKRKESVFLGSVRIAGGDEEVAEFLWTHLENAQIVEIPFFLVYGALGIYFILCAILFHYLEADWTFEDSLYFIIISVLTIGFGDLVPKDTQNQVIAMGVIFIGLVLTSTCLDVLGSYYLDKIHFFGRQIRKSDPLEWLKEVQQRRIRRMKQEAMRKLFECISALNFMNLTPGKFAEIKEIAACESNIQFAQMLAEEQEQMEEPDPPMNLKCKHASSSTVVLSWKEPVIMDQRRFWYTLTYSPKNRGRRRLHSVEVQMIDFINATEFEVNRLNSFTLYEFVLVTSTKYGHSTAVKTQEYTEPCTVPQNLKLVAYSCETATIAWQKPVKNKGSPELYTLYFAQEPAPEFRFWSKFRLGSKTKFTLTDLMPDTDYSVCVSANHNSGLATVSKTLKFHTKLSWLDED